MFTADPDVRDKVLLLGKDQTTAALGGLAPPTGQVKNHLVLPALLQQQAEVVELMDTSGQPERKRAL